MLHVDAAILCTPRDSCMLPILAPESWREYPARTSLVSPLHTRVVSRHARATLILSFHDVVPRFHHNWCSNMKGSSHDWRSNVTRSKATVTPSHEAVPNEPHKDFFFCEVEWDVATSWQLQYPSKTLNEKTGNCTLILCKRNGHRAVLNAYYAPFPLSTWDALIFTLILPSIWWAEPMLFVLFLC